MEKLQMKNDPGVSGPEGHDQAIDRASHKIVPYLRERSPEFDKLCVLREIGWRNPAGDTYFAKQRKVADQGAEKTANRFYIMMQQIGHELQVATAAFRITRNTVTEPPTILDMCMAPGGFLSVALQHNPSAHALAFSLPIASGGHKVLLEGHHNVEQRFLDITMLVTDMGLLDGTNESFVIPPNHPDFDNFVRRRQFSRGRVFDIVLCDGQVLRTHTRQSYREAREAQRLGSTQLALGLEHMRPGGTLIHLLHRVEGWTTMNLLRTFHQFSTVRVFKPKSGHSTRSSFYMIASDVQSQQPEALKAVQHWKKLWQTATFGTDDECWEVFCGREHSVDQVLEQFGDEIVRLGKGIWRTQANALAKAPYIRNAPR